MAEPISTTWFSGTTLFSCIFSTTAHALVVGSLYYMGQGFSFTSELKFSTQRGNNTMAVDFIPSQQEMQPDSAGAILENQMTIHPLEAHFGPHTFRLTHPTEVQLAMLDEKELVKSLDGLKAPVRQQETSPEKPTKEKIKSDIASPPQNAKSQTWNS